jgi:hypothetical protein
VRELRRATQVWRSGGFRVGYSNGGQLYLQSDDDWESLSNREARELRDALTEHLNRYDAHEEER